jgi:hypothetical protein
MPALLANPESPMAAKKAGRPATSGRDDVSVKIDRLVKSTAEYVAAHLGVPIAEYVTEAVRPVAERDFERITRKGASKEGGR